ncbi:hypothetical protein RV18_GL002926 [Enterococcus termitis]|nr:hypothetical protein RV18_GL002926 [Enterococcus termitis]
MNVLRGEKKLKKGLIALASLLVIGGIGFALYVKTEGSKDVALKQSESTDYI